MHAFIRKYVAADDASDEVIEYLTSMASDLDTSAEDFHEALFGFFPALESKAGIANSIAEVIQRVRAGEETGHKEVAPLVSGSMVEPLVASSLSSPPTESVLWKCPRCTFDNPVDSSKEFIACGMCGFDEKQSDAVPLASLAASHQEATQNRSRDDQAVEIQGSHEDSSSDNSTSATQAGGPEPTRDGSAGNEPGEPVKSGGKGQKGKGAKGKNAKGASGQPRPKEEGSSRETQNSSEAGDGTLKSTNESKRSKGKGAKGKGAKGKGAKGAPEQRPLEEDEPTHELPTSSEPEVDELLVSTELEVADTSEPSALQHNSEEEFPSIQSHIAQRGKGVGRSVEWTCAVCTFTHTELLEACEMCCTPRPPEQQLGDHAARSAVPAKAFKQASQKTRRKPAAKDASSIELSPEDDAALILQRVSDVLSSLKTVRTMLEKEQLLELDTLALMTAVDFKEIGLCASDSNALVDAVQQELKVRDLQLPEEASEMVHVSNTGSTKGNSEDGDEANARMRNDISTLMELLPSDAGLDQQQVEYVYRALCMRRLDEASRYLVENFVIDTGASTFRRDAAVHKLSEDSAKWMSEQRAAQLRQQQEEAGQHDDDYKKGLLDRYFDRPDDSKVVHRPVVAWDDPSNKPKGKTTHYRYVDGVRVAMKSAKDKVLVETLSPEWDGGSRGKVKTKGKRGPGPGFGK